MSWVVMWVERESEPGLEAMLSPVVISPTKFLSLAMSRAGFWLGGCRSLDDGGSLRFGMLRVNPSAMGFGSLAE